MTPSKKDSYVVRLYTFSEERTGQLQVVSILGTKPQPYERL